ncbi:anti-sigma F factor antagonist [Domibacillus epiphyticus]|uniref:Anti-sigma F factor antagonist n=1 Tax=Domibacillus epiphyticus TaxID=1714355 RepID=A0A1V2A4J4_9BACI|nr:anti-sigma F factor antagonist [Domibacillus epiphyticus]OMP65906.1 anti-sigma F factor antagonist [Domibacillus epiphyticus]
MLTMTAETSGKILCVRLTGELDHYYSEQVKEFVESEMEANQTQHLIWNLEQLSFMDSSGLGVVLGRYRQVNEMGGSVTVCGLNTQVKRLFQLSGLFKIMYFEKTEQDALRRLEGSSCKMS